MESIPNGYRVLSSIAQGSVLDPLLFVLYISDLAACENFAKIFLFADDAKLFKRVTRS